MIVKTCSIPIKATLIEAALSRLALNHPKRQVLEAELGRRMAGYRGEQSVSSALDILLEKEYLIFHDVRLQGKPYPFQMDLLILSSSFFLILEVKNIAGELFFDDSFKQMIRTLPDQKDAYDDPVLQVHLQRKQLKEWLSAKKIPPIPMEVLVVSANSKSILQAKNKRLADVIVRKNHLASKLEELANKHQQECLSKKELKKLTQFLLKSHTPYIPKLLESHHISPNELTTGVQCPKCATIPMMRKWGKWLCGSCSFASRDAHFTALRDYSLLIKPTISNRELRTFLQIESEYVATRILSSLNVPYTGSTKDRVYYLNWRDFVANSQDSS